MEEQLRLNGYFVYEWPRSDLGWNEIPEMYSFIERHREMLYFADCNGCRVGLKEFIPESPPYGQFLGKCWRLMTNSPEIGHHMDLHCQCSQRHIPLVGMTKQTRASAYYTPDMVKRAVRAILKPMEPKCMMEELEELEVDLAAGQVDAAEVPEGYTVLKDASRQQLRKWLQDFHLSLIHI